MTSKCLTCGRVAEVTIAKDQATVLGGSGCGHIEEIGKNILDDSNMVTLTKQRTGLELEFNGRNSLPVRLWQENPHRLVSLRNMLRVYAEQYLFIGRCLQYWLSIDTRVPLPEKLQIKAAEDFMVIVRECEALGLPVTLTYVRQRVAEWFPDEGKGEMTGGQIVKLARGIEEIFKAELDSQLFLYVPSERARYWLDLDDTPKKQLFGDVVATNFPSATYDIDEAGRSLAVARNTACVFHLMRVLEIGLATLGATFSVSLARTNWAPAIDQIESKIRTMHTDPIWKAQPDCKEQQEFYAQAASHFGILKDAWRNYTAHARGKYDEQEAEAIFIAVRGFMQKLATRLHE